VLVELTRQRRLALPRLVEQGPGAVQARLGVVGGLGGLGRPLPGLFEGGASGTGRRRAHPPAGHAEPPAGAGDHHRVRVGQRHVDGL
jgi:hypothetical protein